MARYIDADKAIDALTGWDTDPTDEEIKWTIDKIPTADVAEVKHGEWVDKYNNKYDNHLYECSVCGVEALYEAYENELGQTKLRQVLTEWCPHCGAKMEGGTYGNRNT